MDASVLYFVLVLVLSGCLLYDDGDWYSDQVLGEGSRFAQSNFPFDLYVARLVFSLEQFENV